MVYNPNKATHPGYIIARSLEREEMTQKNLSERTGLTEKHISQIINGEASVTVDTALLLENVLGGTASFWINLEKGYQETKARLERNELRKREVALLPMFPYAELVKQECIEQTSNKEKKVENLWKFFGVNSLNFVENTEAIAYAVIAYRRRTNVRVKKEALAAWLRCGELEARKSQVSQFSENLLKTSVDRLKSLTLRKAEAFSSEAKNILAESGVSLIYIPHFKGTQVSGAVRWIGDSPLIQLSLFRAYADIFWFNLFHEIGHILLHGKKDQFIKFKQGKGIQISGAEEKEREADDFATNELIEKREYESFVERGDYSKPAIVKFSRERSMHPGILAGRLCYEKKLKWSDVSGLRDRLVFAKE